MVRPPVDRAGGFRGAGGAAVGVPGTEPLPHRVPGASFGGICWGDLNSSPNPQLTRAGAHQTFTLALDGITSEKETELSEPSIK